MKYGDSLQQRSIPEWGAYNIDYNEIKRLIKIRTTKDQAKSISIPGKGNEGKALRAFENELYTELHEQHQRIDLFVQSKSGEISRKLNHLHKQIVQLDRHNVPGEQSRLSIRRLEKYSRVEDAILKVGEEIQSLSRFVGVQRLAFQKLLKKYKKWTGSATLGKRVESEILGRPSSFSHQTFEPLLAAWTTALVSVRAPFAEGATWNAAVEDKRGSATQGFATSHWRHYNGGIAEERLTQPNKVRSSIAQHHDAAIPETEIVFDAALAALPLGPAAGTAVYWVHPDNTVELQVLLLQHMRLRSLRTASSRSNDLRSSDPPRRMSNSSNRNSHAVGIEDNVGQIVLDDLERFANRQSGAVVDDNQVQNAAASIRYCARGEAVVLVGTTSDVARPENESKRPLFQKARLKRKHLGELFNTSMSQLSSNPCPKERPNGTTKQGQDPMQDLENVRKWFVNHQEVVPLVDIQYHRKRFVGGGNDTPGALWATLDREVSMRKAHSSELGRSQDSTTLRKGDPDFGDILRFPYAVLEIRWEGDMGLDLVRALDQSHLTERVRGFSLETHAVAVLYISKFTSPPFWLTAVGKDIRKVPAAPVPLGRRSSTQLSCRGSASTKPASTSATSTVDSPSSNGFCTPVVETPSTSVPDMLDSPLSGAPKRQPRTLLQQLPSRRVIDNPSQLKRQRYWNEFDDGDEASEDEPYTILVDPHASRSSPGTARVYKLASLIVSKINLPTKKVRHLLRSPKKTSTGVRRPLKANESASRLEAHLLDPDNDDSSTEQPCTQRTYATFPDFDYSNDQGCQNRETLLFRLSIAAFMASFILLFIAALLAFTARRKAALPADLGILVGIIAALISGVSGVALMYAREERLSWPHRFTVLMAFALVCVASGVLLVMVGSV